jgi:peptide/nickel transport system ATP-binding protein
MNSTHLLEVKDLVTEFKTDSGVVRAVDGVSYYIDEGEIVGLVGESGCGKSATQLSLLQLIPTPPGKVVSGEVLFEGNNILSYESESENMREIRGGKIGMIFQEPMTSLNPVLTVGKQIIESLMLHLKIDKHAARKRTLELIGLMGIPDAEQRIDSYPHQFSGGMRQRLMIAMALSCNPKVLIADEPTTALDVTTQAQILEILQDKASNFKTALLIVTHNLGIVARYAQRIYIMYAGRVVESGKSEDIFNNPTHPYTIGLLKSVPRLDEPKGRKLVPIAGLPPNLINMPDSCAFHPRCCMCTEACKEKPWPGLRHLKDQHYAACDNTICEKGDMIIDR